MFYIRAIIFDFDGVICFTDKFHTMAWRTVTENMGLRFDSAIGERLRGIGRFESAGIILDANNRDQNASIISEMADKKNEIYLSFVNDMKPTDVDAGVRQLIESLHERGFFVAVGSTSKNTRRTMKQINILNLFDVVVDGNDVSIAKPNPDIYLSASRKLGVSPKECAVVEDASAGIIAAKKAGMTAFAYHGSAGSSGEADYCLDSLTELSDIIALSR